MKRIESLNEKEKLILDLLLKNMRNKEIADKTKMKLKTIKYYLTRIYKKLGVDSRYSALFYCLKAKYLTQKNI